MKKLRLWCSGLLIACVGLWLTGCTTVCCKNQQEGLASIVCQPMDETVKLGGTARFEVKTPKCGHVAYQWYFNGKPIESERKDCRGTRESLLEIFNVETNNLGYYWCEIESLDSHGNQVRTRTRDAALGYSARMLFVYPPQHWPMPPAFPGSIGDCGGPYCGCVVFKNGGAGFMPAIGQTKGVASIKVGGVQQGQNKFNLFWRVNGKEAGCAAVLAGSSPPQKWFLSSNPKKYFITVYFPQCPAPGTDVELTINFVP